MTMDQQAAMERLQDLYREKNEYLEEFLEWITPYEFYREVFPVGSFERRGHFEDAKGNGIAVTIPKGKAGAGGDGVRPGGTGAVLVRAEHPDHRPAVARQPHARSRGQGEGGNGGGAPLTRDMQS